MYPDRHQVLSQISDHAIQNAFSTMKKREEIQHPSMQMVFSDMKVKIQRRITVGLLWRRKMLHIKITG
jgi:hypothetical protein